MAGTEPSLWWNPITGALAFAKDAILSTLSGGKLLRADAERIRQETVDAMRRAGATEDQVQAFLNNEWPKVVKSVGGIAEESIQTGVATLGTIAKWAVVALVAIAAIQIVRELRV